MRRFYVLSLITLIVVILVAVGCKSDEDNGPTGNGTTEAWVGSWLSAGTDVAPLLVALFNYDSVFVEMNENNTVTLSTHVTGGAWTDLSGTYAVTKSATGDVHSITISYIAFEQSGIVQVIDASPDTLKLEVVQTTPDIGATPRTPQSGFGSDVTLGTANIQVYLRQ